MTGTTEAGKGGSEGWQAAASPRLLSVLPSASVCGVPPATCGCEQEKRGPWPTPRCLLSPWGRGYSDRACVGHWGVQSWGLTRAWVIMEAPRKRQWCPCCGFGKHSRGTWGDPVCQPTMPRGQRPGYEGQGDCEKTGTDMGPPQAQAGAHPGAMDWVCVLPPRRAGMPVPSGLWWTVAGVGGSCHVRAQALKEFYPPLVEGPAELTSSCVRLREQEGCVRHMRA